MAARPSVDHLVVASADLAVGTEWVARRLGVTPAPGGVHPGLGTRNALLGLGDLYLEVLALDPAQQGRSSRFADLARGRGEPALVTLAVARDDLEDPVPMSRRRPDGTSMSWQVQFTGTPLFYIDWLDSPRPAGLPDGGSLTRLTVTTPAPQELAGVAGIEVREGPWHVEADVDGTPLA
ncbi:VOC family protein [Nocardioides aestuarii]|uniref:VOC family protein n=1 Tax=Nocardioides aestuarii TaxID=252231 RepID=A0ABW4TSK5_9ACTN